MSRRSKETYKHMYAKEALKELLLNGYMGINPLRVDIEVNFYAIGKLWFRPDVVCYSKDIGLSHIFEIYYSHPLNKNKVRKMVKYFEINGIFPIFIEISCDKILNECTIN